MEHESTSRQTYSFGTIDIRVGVDGDVDKPAEFCDYMLASAAAISELEGLRRLNNGMRSDKGTKQTCSNHITFGAISINLEVGFELATDVSNRTLNDIVAEINLLLWTAYGSFMGNDKGLGQKTHRAVLDNINAVLTATGSGQISNGHGQTGRTAQGGHRPSSSRSRPPRAARR